MSLAYHARYLCSVCDRYHKPGSKPFVRCMAILEARAKAHPEANRAWRSLERAS